MGKAKIPVNPEYYNENRKRFAEKMSQQSICVLFSGTAHRRSADADYPFFANRNFYYLTGIEQEGSALLITKMDESTIRLQLCIRNEDPTAERWTGRRLTREEATAISGINDISFSEELDSVLGEMMVGWNGVICMDNNAISESSVWLKDFISTHHPEQQITDVYAIFSDLRAVKSLYEIEMLRKAISITAQGIRQVYETARIGMAEYQLATEFEGVLGKMGAGTVAFESIVATGTNFNYLHYPQLDATVKAGDLILLDVGASWGGLNADISRAFPIDGKFSDKQLAVYRVVRACQEEAFGMLRPGITIKEVNLACKQVAAQALLKLDVISSLENIDQYYWHNVSHHLGYDVHDIISRERELEASMVITVEPGIYIPEWEVGLRIEDDVLITNNGCEVLSADVPREPEEIEMLLTINSEIKRNG